MNDSYIAEIDASDAEKGVYAHYMLKEFMNNLAVMRRIIQEYQDAEGNLKIDQDIIMMLKKQTAFTLLQRYKLPCRFSR